MFWWRRYELLNKHVYWSCNHMILVTILFKTGTTVRAVYIWCLREELERVPPLSANICQRKLALALEWCQRHGHDRYCRQIQSMDYYPRWMFLAVRSSGRQKAELCLLRIHLQVLENLADNPRNEVWVLSGLPVKGALERLAERVPGGSSSQRMGVSLRRRRLVRGLILWASEWGWKDKVDGKLGFRVEGAPTLRSLTTWASFFFSDQWFQMTWMTVQFTERTTSIVWRFSSGFNWINQWQPGTLTTIFATPSENAMVFASSPAKILSKCFKQHFTLDSGRRDLTPWRSCVLTARRGDWGRRKRVCQHWSGCSRFRVCVGARHRWRRKVAKKVEWIGQCRERVDK